MIKRLYGKARRQQINERILAGVSFPDMEVFDEWREDMLLHGAWVSLMDNGREITPRLHTTMKVSGGKLVFDPCPLKWQIPSGTVSPVAAGLWLHETGGRHLPCQFIVSAPIAPGQYLHIDTFTFSLT
jgi:hypothetical protein